MAMDQPDPGTRMPIIGVLAGDVPARVLVVGDPARAERIAPRLEAARTVGRNREYLTIVGRHRGTDVAVVSHGVGSAGAAVCFEELCRSGARRLIRAGTCGGMQDHVLDGDLVIARGAVRDEGLTARLVPPTFPALADPDVVMALRAAAAGRAGSAGERAVPPPVEGIVLTSDIFYPHDVLGSDLPMWQRAGVVAVEMEVAALLVVAHLHGAAAGAILTVDGNPLARGDAEMSGYDPHRTVVTDATELMIGIALDALVA